MHDYSRIKEKQQEILLRRGLQGYQRDITVFHELSHLLYDNEAGLAFSRSEKKIIAEWNA